MATRKHVTLRHIWDVEVDCLEAIDSEPRIGLCPFLSTARGQLTNCVRDRCRLWLALAEGGGECGFLSIAKESIPIRDATHAEMPFGRKHEERSDSVAGSAHETRSAERLVLSIPEVTHLLRISRATVYALVRQGELPSVRFGRRLLIPRKALLDKLGQPWGSAQ
jgi:excisionase family DNA binding protein